MPPTDLPDERALVPYEASRLEARRVLVLAPHADDEVFACGGALAQLAASGASIDVLLVTDGAAAGRDESDRRRIAAGRAAESREALRILGGGTIHEGGLPDRGLRARGHELEDLLSTWLAKTTPDLVFAPSPVETHPDHRAVAVALLALAARPAGEVGREALHAARVAFFELSQPFRPNVLVDVTPVRERKERAMAAFVSQAAERDYAGLVRGLNAFRRMTLPQGVAAAEGYAVFSGDLLAAPERVFSALLPAAPRCPLSVAQRLRVLFTGRLF